MTDETRDGPDDEGRVEEAFSLVGNEIRAEVVRVLGDARMPEGRAELSFSDIRERVNADVDSSRFNYHLGQLLGEFVEETEDGYRLSIPGMEVYRTVRAGVVTDAPELEGFDAGFDCYACGTGVVARIREDLLWVECPECERTYTMTVAPPSALAGGPDDLLDRVDRYQRSRLSATTRGVCPRCMNALGARFLDAADAPLFEGDELDVLVHRECDNCGKQPYHSVGLGVLDDPGVVAFLADHDVAVDDRRMWSFDWAMTDRRTSGHSRDPWRVAVTIEADGDALEVVVDDEMQVVERDRRDAD
jgi:DNA-binding transcriptional ArsR family regulator